MIILAHYIALCRHVEELLDDAAALSDEMKWINESLAADLASIYVYIYIYIYIYTYKLYV